MRRGGSEEEKKEWKFKRPKAFEQSKTMVIIILGPEDVLYFPLKGPSQPTAVLYRARQRQERHLEKGGHAEVNRCALNACPRMTLKNKMEHVIVLPGPP